MKKSSLIRAFLSIVIVALGGVLLLKNLSILLTLAGIFSGVQFGLQDLYCLGW